MQSISDSFLLPANEVWGKVILLHLSVILFTGGSTWAGTPWDRYTPLAGTPPGQVTPLGRYTPLAGTPPGRYIPQAGTPPWAGIHTPPPWAGTPPRQVHPLGRYTPPQEQCMLGDTGNKRAVCILLEFILVPDEELHQM